MNLEAQRKLESFERLDGQGAYNQALRYLHEAATALGVGLDWSDARGTWRVVKRSDDGVETREFRTTWGASQLLWDYSHREG